MMNKCWDKFTTSIVTTYTPDFFSELVATDWPPPPPVNLATVQIFGLTKTTFRSRLLSAPVTLSPGRSRTVWIMKAMISESSRLSCKRPGAAPLKNEKAGLFCCSQISPLLKNPIKRQKKVTFPFTAMTHGGSEAPVRSEMGGPLMRPVRGGFDPGGEELLIDWTSTTSPALCQSPKDSFLSCSLFLWPPVIARFQKRSVPSHCPHLTSLPWSWQPRRRGGTRSIRRPCVAAISRSHLSCRHLFSPHPSCFLSFLSSSSSLRLFCLYLLPPPSPSSPQM